MGGYHTNFNSIKVRLELFGANNDLQALFDFNSIKVRSERYEEAGINPYFALFQFHKGAIRTIQGTGGSSEVSNFNSIKVRLEQKADALKSQQEMNFNSIKVRLEPTCPVCSHRMHPNFNSIKVRLELQTIFI